MSRRSRVVIAAIVAAVAAVATACTSGTAGERSDASELSSSATAPSTPSDSTGGSATALPTPTSTAPSTAEVTDMSTPPATSSETERITVKASGSTTPKSTCTALTVRVIRGSADRGREFAALQFTNDGATRCTLYGYPLVTLVRSGRQIGTASQPATTTDSRFDLAPGDTAESRLDDFTDCQAALSDTVRVVVPGSTQTASRPGELRACTLRVSKLGTPD